MTFWQKLKYRAERKPCAAATVKASFGWEIFLQNSFPHEFGGKKSTAPVRLVFDPGSFYEATP
jgi:hypothetical protein